MSQGAAIVGDRAYGHAKFSDVTARLGRRRRRSDGLGNRIVRRRALHARERHVVGVQTFGEEADRPNPHGFELHLGLPFVHVGQAFGGERLQERIRPSSTKRRWASLKAGEPKPSEQAEAMTRVPPGSRISIGVTMPLTVW